MDGTGGNSKSASSASFLQQLREQHAGPLTVIWDISPAHRGDTLRGYLAIPGMRLRLVNPVSSTGQALCLGAKALVQEKVSELFTQLSSRRDE